MKTKMSLDVGYGLKKDCVADQIQEGLNAVSKRTTWREQSRSGRKIMKIQILFNVDLICIHFSSYFTD